MTSYIAQETQRTQRREDAKGVSHTNAFLLYRELIPSNVFGLINRLYHLYSLRLSAFAYLALITQCRINTHER